MCETEHYYFCSSGLNKHDFAVVNMIYPSLGYITNAELLVNTKNVLLRLLTSESLYHMLFNCNYTSSLLLIPTFNYLLVNISSLF